MHFPDHTADTAPPSARRALAATATQFGDVPAAVARLATSPELLNGFLKLSALFETTTLAPLERETLILTVATRNECHFCVAMHTAKLVKLGAPADVVSALRSSSVVPSPGLEALRAFVLKVLETAGDAQPADLDAFLAAGYTPRQALEVVLGIGTYTMSTFANRLVAAPLHPSLAEHAWTGSSREIISTPNITRSA